MDEKIIVTVNKEVKNLIKNKKMISAVKELRKINPYLFLTESEIIPYYIIYTLFNKNIVKEIEGSQYDNIAFHKIIKDVTNTYDFIYI